VKNSTDHATYPIELAMRYPSALSEAARCLALWLVLCVGSAAQGQVLVGEWVDESQRAIEEHRKTEVTVIVLDENDRAIRGAQVRVEQVRHDFVLGLTIPGEAGPPDGLDDAQLWRCFNAVALDRLTRWVAMSQDDRASAARSAQADRWIEAIDPVGVSFGPVFSADPAHNPDALGTLEPDGRSAALMQRMVASVESQPHPAMIYDLYADALGHRMVEDRLGFGFLNRCYDSAHALARDAQFNLRVRNGMHLQRSRELYQRVQALQLRQVKIDGITIDQQFTGTISAPQMRRTLDDRIHALSDSITVANLEVGGPSIASAAFNLETVLRLLFAEPSIKGIYFAGLYEEELNDPVAALIDSEGELTSAGTVVDGLFRELWWSDEQLVSDDLGNAKARVFTGWYRITATLPDGSELESEVYLPQADEPRIVVLQQTAR